MPKHSTRRRLLTATAVLGSAIAATPQAAIMEEIVVTAQKREQNVQDVGIAISALSGDQMRQLGYSNAQQVTAMAPGVSTVQPNGEANYSIAIRGVANSDFTTNVESPVAIYLDEVYISQMSGAGFMLFDMERVEILRGPQGTLFGRNATGGLAHFVTRKPTEEFEGYAQATVGDYDQIKLEGALGGPITEQLMARVSFSTHDNDGYAENRFLNKKLNNANDEAYRAQVLWTPTDSMEILLNARAGEQSINTGFFEHVTSNITGQLTPNEVNVVTGYIDNDGDVFEGDFDRDGHNDLETRGYTGTLKWDFDNFTLTSITDISTVKRDYIEDSDASPVPLFNFFLTTDAEQFSQEVRVNGGNEQMNWVAGAYFLDLNIEDSNGAETEPFIDPNSDTPDVSGLDNPYITNTESISVFGQVEWDFTDTITGIAGLRWISDKKDHAYLTNAVDFIPGSTQRNGNPNILANLGAYEGDRKDSELAWRLGLNWQASDDALLFFSYNRGVKSGGYNSPIFPLSPPLDYVDDVMSYDPEQLDAYEVGFKTTWAEGLLQLNGSAYYYDYQDYQAFQIIGIDTITTNAEGESFGGEIELKASPVEGLEFMFGAAYNDVEVDLKNGTPKTTSIQSPKWNITALARYEIPVGPGRVALQYDIVHRSKHYFALTRLPTVTQKSYEISNVSIGWLDADDRWMVTGFVNNLSDEEYLVQTFDLSGPSVFGLTEQYYGRPRWYGVSVLFNF